MAKHVPNRRNLDEAEIDELDRLMVDYEDARERAKAALLAAQAAYQAEVIRASEARDDGILRIIDAAGGRGTQARAIEHLGMNPSYMSIRLRASRARQGKENDGTA